MRTRKAPSSGWQSSPMGRPDDGSAEFVRIDRDEVRTPVVTGDIDALAKTRFRVFLADALVDLSTEPASTSPRSLTSRCRPSKVLAHFLKVAAAADFRLRVDAGSAVRSACGERGDAEWLLSRFEPFIAPTTRTEPAFVGARRRFRLAGRWCRSSIRLRHCGGGRCLARAGGSRRIRRIRCGGRGRTRPRRCIPTRIW